ncbi:hypothetical protein [Xenorhabdus cabanillasii]|uniref:Uncharacterized protein n=1 Tax=Xenorhabdus cabanillasii JM26 TaxID=1427517 RepID=W1J6F5_9GAMM|nr:hypothetical protein [Xenorhabdus cabanillasii]PHM75744.1 hypothetical protein Xcab_03730 [Xenorhabdus cabanillasii JM26]CDL86337.1 hypothetical protein XCR1_3030007 [Xenorhabdus cabanillasii JM26]
MRFSEIGDIFSETGRKGTAMAVLFYMLDKYDDGVNLVSIDELVNMTKVAKENLSSLCSRLNKAGLLTIKYITPDGTIYDERKSRLNTKSNYQLSEDVLRSFKRSK